MAAAAGDTPIDPRAGNVVHGGYGCAIGGTLITIYFAAGGLMTYGPNSRKFFRRLAAYVQKILANAKPDELPIEQPTTFELVINLKTAKSIGLTVPATLLARADEVIE